MGATTVNDRLLVLTCVKADSPLPPVTVGARKSPGNPYVATPLASRMASVQTTVSLGRTLSPAFDTEPTQPRRDWAAGSDTVGAED